MPSRRIALIFPYDLGHCRGILRGIRAFAADQRDWVFTPVDPESKVSAALRDLSPAGIIAHVYRRSLAAALLSAKCPVVNVAGVYDDLPFPRVGLDNRDIGRMAAEHLLSSGFRQFAFVGQRDHAYSEHRYEGYISRLAPASVLAYNISDRSFRPHGRPWGVDRHLTDWLAELPRPVGLFASNDLLGSQVAEACRQAGRRVPEDIAIVGVDNDDLLCDLARPSLSSVQLPSEALGREAARLLDLLLAGRSPRKRPTLLTPRRVVVRQSSDVLAIKDDLVASDLRYIREHAEGGFAIEQLLSELAVSRRLLERRFREQLGRGIWEELRRLRLLKACDLLASTTMSVERVAMASGFSSLRHLSVTFRAGLDTTPTAYRRQMAG